MEPKSHIFPSPYGSEIKEWSRTSGRDMPLTVVVVTFPFPFGYVCIGQRRKKDKSRKIDYVTREYSPYTNTGEDGHFGPGCYNVYLVLRRLNTIPIKSPL